jgi:hypothetical protein
MEKIQNFEELPHESTENTDEEKEKIQDILDKVMTAEEYSRSSHETPYIYDLKSGENEISYFGAPHVSDPSDPLFDQIENKFNESSPDLVLVEGMGRLKEKRGFLERNDEGDGPEALRKKVIEKAGEAGFALLLAVQKGAACESPEPLDADMYSHLLEKGFSKEDIFTEQIFLVLPQYHRQMEKEGFENYAKYFIKMFAEATNWDNFDYSYEHAYARFSELLGKEIDVESVENSIDYVDPIPWEERKDAQTVLNAIARETSLYRDQFIVSQIAEYLKTYKRIFTVYGSSHAFMQEPALRALLNVENKA